MKKIFESLTGGISRYLQLRMTSLSLNLIEDIAKVLGFAAFFLIAGGFFFLAFLYISFGMAMYLGELFQQPYLGMLMTGGFILLLLVILLLLRKTIWNSFADKSAAFMAGLKRQEEEDSDL